MENDKSTQDKIDKPHSFFVAPREVVTDPDLSKEEKLDVLETLEQDARQLASASDEGMTGGEPNQLHEVLNAKESLAMPPIEQAYDVVIEDLRARLKTGLTDASYAAIERALTTIAGLSRSA